MKTTTKLFKESLDDFFKLFDSSPSAMAITDIRRLKFVKVNEKFVEFFGYKKEEVIGRTAIDISIHDETEFNRILNFLKENQGFQNQIFALLIQKAIFPSKKQLEEILMLIFPGIRCNILKSSVYQISIV